MTILIAITNSKFVVSMFTHIFFFFSEMAMTGIDRRWKKKKERTTSKQVLKLWLSKRCQKSYSSETLLVFVSDSNPHFLNPVANFIKKFIEEPGLIRLFKPTEL